MISTKIEWSVFRLRVNNEKMISVLYPGEWIQHRNLSDLIGSDQPTKSDGIPGNESTNGSDGRIPIDIRWFPTLGIRRSDSDEYPIVSNSWNSTVGFRWISDGIQLSEYDGRIPMNIRWYWTARCKRGKNSFFSFKSKNENQKNQKN